MPGQAASATVRAWRCRNGTGLPRCHGLVVAYVMEQVAIMDRTRATTGCIVVGAFDDAPHVARAGAGLRAAGLRFEQVPGRGGDGTRPPAVDPDAHDRRRATVLGGAFVGAVAVGLVAIGAIPPLGLGPPTGVGVALAALVGAPLGAPSAARGVPASPILLQVRAIGDHDVPRVRALLARDGASRTWSYRPPPGQGEAAATLRARGGGG